MSRRRVWGVASVSGGLVSLTWGFLVAIIYWAAFGHRRSYDRIATPVDYGLKHEVLEITTADGLHLTGWYLPGKLKGAVIVSGGYRSAASDVLGISAALQRAGFHVFMYGWRGTAGSDVAAHTLGVYERHDLIAVINAAYRKLGKVPIGLLGYSMGGSVSISVAASDSRIKAVVSDSAFADPSAVIGDRVRSILRIPSSLLVWPVVLLQSRVTGARFTDFSPIKAVPQVSPRPILIIHGARDVAVPLSHGERLYAAAHHPKQLWMVPDAGHVGAYFQDRELYVSKVVRFFQAALLGQGQLDQVLVNANTQ